MDQGFVSPFSLVFSIFLYSLPFSATLIPKFVKTKKKKKAWGYRWSLMMDGGDWGDRRGKREEEKKL